MNPAQIASALLDEALVPALDDIPEGDTFFLPLIEEAEARARLHGPPGLPPLDLPCAHAGLRFLLESARFLRRRELSDFTALRLPQIRTPAEHWSADLFLRFLPGLHHAASSLDQADPLLAKIEAAALVLPLSSTSIASCAGSDPAPLLTDAAVLALYLDRIAETEDKKRLEVPVVRAAFLARLGEHDELTP